MVDSNLLTYFIILELASFLLTWKFYVAAGRKAWEAAIPFYKTYVMMGIIQRKKWQTILFFIPVVSNVMTIVMVYELLHVFNYRKLKHTLYTIATLGLYLGYINYSKTLKYVGKDDQNIKKTVGELGSSLLFAIVAATVIRAFTFEAYTIPTSSMEKSLMVGDFLFVSKMHYGSRLPVTPLSVPLVHNKVPLLNVDSYLEWVQLPYIRLPKISSLNRMDPVVFNYPAEDIRPINMDGKIRPIDKGENYVKRCVAIPGDTLKIEHREVLINGEALEFPERAKPQFVYIAVSGAPLDINMLKKRFDINPTEIHERYDNNRQRYYYDFPATEAAAAGLKEMGISLEVAEVTDPSANVVFPNTVHTLSFPWTADNYGPLYIPAKGQSISLNEETFVTYKRVIEMYDAPNMRSLTKEGNQYFLDGEAISTYTFNQDYYFMMGDNRHMSDDSRFWGFVPEDRIVGKPVFIWMSYDTFGDGFKNKIRWDRVFTTVSGKGERVSYFWYFLVAVVLISIGNRYYKKRKAK
jgi:signal peptidase I